MSERGERSVVKHMFTCSVGCHHGISIERWENDEGTEWEDAANGAIDVDVWEGPPLILRERIKQAWRMLRGKKTLIDGICLTVAEAQDMARYLLSLSSAAHPGEARRVTATNAQASITCTHLTAPTIRPESFERIKAAIAEDDNRKEQ